MYSIRVIVIEHANWSNSFTDERSRVPTLLRWFIIGGEMFPPRILVVDDSEVTRNILAAIINSKQWIVCGEAHDGPSALAQFKQLLPDVVLLDLALPGGPNGIEVARQMSVIDPSVPIILFTGYSADVLASTARNAGVCAIVPKGECWTLISSIEQAFTEYDSPIQ